MVTEKQILKEHPLFAPLSRLGINRLSAASSLNEYPKGSLVVRQGEPCKSLFVVLSGRCEVLSHSTRQGHEKLAAILRSGDTIGQWELLYSGRYRNTVRVATDSVFLEVSTDEVKPLLDKNSKLVNNFAHAAGAHRARQDSSGAHKRRAHKLGRVVTLGHLHARAEEWSAAEQIGAQVRRETGQPVVVVELSSLAYTHSLDDWKKNGASLQDGFCFDSALEYCSPGVQRLRVRLTGDGEEAGCIPAFIGHLNQHFPFVILHTDFSASVPASLECMIQSDLAYIFLRQDSEDLYMGQLLMRELTAASPTIAGSVCANFLLKKGEHAAPIRKTSEKLGVRPESISYFLQSLDKHGRLLNGGRSLDSCIRRMARRIGRCRLGVALSCGGSRGLAHIGVLQVLEENGIEIDVIAGSSMGAYIGAVWAAGFDGLKMQEFAAELSDKRTVFSMADPSFPPRQGFIYGNKMRKRLKNTIGNLRFSELQRPLRIVATNLNTLEKAVFGMGNVAAAVHASAAIPGICVPVRLADGETYIDGGICDPMPVDVLRDMGVERVLAVSVVPSLEKAMENAIHNRERRNALKNSRNPLRKISRFLNTRLNYFAEGNILDILMRSVSGAQIRVAAASERNADILLHPYCADGEWHNFHCYEKYIRLGRLAAGEQLAAIQKLAHRPA